MANDTTTPAGRYEWFHSRQQALCGMLAEGSALVEGLGMDSMRRSLAQLSSKVGSDAFRIQVAGTFKNGKSTLINALLGEDVLPAYTLPCTAVINEIKYGPQKKAVLHFRDPLPEKLYSDIPAAALAHMQAHGMAAVPPMEIPYSDIHDYVVIPIGKDPGEMLLESPYEMVELFWPLDLLKNGVVIIDSPGLNEHRTRTEVTMGYLSKADAILFVLNAQALCSQEEMRFIAMDLEGHGFTDPFFVVNRFDIVSDGEKDMVRRFAQAKLSQYSTRPVHFVSALQGLGAKKADDTQAFAASGMQGLETALSDYLTTSRGKVKLSQPTRELRRILTEEALGKTIPQARSALSSSLAEVKARYEAAKPVLEDIRLRRDHILGSIAAKIQQSRTKFEKLHHGASADLMEDIPRWIEGYEPQARLGFIPRKSQTEAAITEISTFVMEKIEESSRQWERAVLVPVLEDTVKEIFSSYEDDLRSLFEKIDQVNWQVSGIDEAPDYKDVPLWERIAGLAGGLLLGNPLLAVSGGINGIGKAMLVTFGMQIAGGLVLNMFGLLNPVTAIGMVAGIFLMNTSMGAEGAMNRLKKQLSEHFVEQIREGADRNAAGVADTAVEKFNELSGNISLALENEILDTEAKIRSIIQELSSGQEAAARRKAALAETEMQITSLNTRLDGLIFDLMD